MGKEKLIKTVTNYKTWETQRHKQVEVDGVTVDEGMAVLLPEVWRLGFKTNMSCEQDSQRRAWISFVSVSDGLRFLSICEPLMGPDWMFRTVPWARGRINSDVRFPVAQKDEVIQFLKSLEVPKSEY